MKLFKKENWVLSIINEWKQLKGKYNWYSFTFINLYFEDEPYTGGVELHFTLLGLGFIIRYNYDFEGSEAGKIIMKYEKELEKTKKKITKKKGTKKK